jgi:hypothetical protein
MTTEWLTARSFERSHEIISAINTLSIHSKRLVAGKTDVGRETEVAEARNALLAFLERFNAVVRQAEEQREATIVGADPRLSSLAKKFMVARRQLPQRPLFHARSLDELRDLLKAAHSTHRDQLVRRIVISQSTSS